MTLGLFLDTSSKQPVMVLISEDRVIDTYTLNSDKSSSVFVKAVAEFLNKNTVFLKDLSYLCVGTGPGSFIGTRVGVILSKTFSYALKIPLLHFSSLMCYKIDKEGSFAILSDAKSKGFYAIFGRKDVDSIVYEKEPRLISKEELILFRDSTHFFCPDSDFISQKIISDLPVNSTEFDFAQIANLSQKEHLEHLNNPTSITSPEIFYLRLS